MQPVIAVQPGSRQATCNAQTETALAISTEGARQLDVAVCKVLQLAVRG